MSDVVGKIEQLTQGLTAKQVDEGFRVRYTKTKEQLKEALDLLQVAILNGHTAGCECPAPLCVRRKNLLGILGRL